MKKSRDHFIARATVFLLLAVSCFSACAPGKTEPWDPAQLMPPEELATVINNPQGEKPLIISIGPGDLIKGSVAVGQTRDQESLDKLRELLSDKAKDTGIVLYCGCCPFKDCPNIRPAFTLVNSMGFNRHKLLNLSHNLKTDWIDKGYPVDMP